MKRLISRHRDQLVRISADELPAKYRVVTPFDRTVDVEHCQRLRIRQCHHFERLNRPIGAFQVVVRGVPPFEDRTVESDVIRIWEST